MEYRLDLEAPCKDVWRVLIDTRHNIVDVLDISGQRHTPCAVLVGDDRIAAQVWCHCFTVQPNGSHTARKDSLLGECQTSEVGDDDGSIEVDVWRNHTFVQCPS